VGAVTNYDIMEIIFATGNQNKVKEVNALLPESIKMLSLKDIGFTEDIEETGKTIEENSLLKAQTIFDIYKKPVLAEDTGLEVFALNNEPGVYSARYAGEPSDSDKNMDLLLDNLKDKESRKAQFKTVATYIDANTTHTSKGIVLGEITTEKKGDGGFGYDPIFQPAGFKEVFAEMTMAQKGVISHRAIAMNKMIKFLKSI